MKSKIPQIITERLALRLFQESDAEIVAKLCNNYNIYKNTIYIPYPYTIQHAKDWIKDHYKKFVTDQSYELAITDKETGDVYGAIALSNKRAFNNGEIAYWVGEPYWGKGYATEATKAMLDFAFINKGYHKVFARYFSSNIASGRVMEKVGMKQEGILREHIIKEGQYIDLIYYGVLRDEYLKSKN